MTGADLHILSGVSRNVTGQVRNRVIPLKSLWDVRGCKTVRWLSQLKDALSIAVKDAVDYQYLNKLDRFGQFHKKMYRFDLIQRGFY